MTEISRIESIAQLLSIWVAAKKLELHPQEPIASQLADMKLQNFVIGLLDLEESEAADVELLSGSDGLIKRCSESFHEALQQTIRQLQLFKLFARRDDAEYHRSILPAAYNERTGEHYPQAMARWRADFRAMSPEQQMMAATIIWLYRSGPDSIWLRRVPCTWRASEALHYMHDVGCLSLWLRLIARYPGW